MSAVDFNPLVAQLAREKRRMDRVGGLLVAAQARHDQAAAALDRAIYEACRAPAAGPVQEPLPLGTRLKFSPVREVRALVLAAVPVQSHAMVNGHRTSRCSNCHLPGHHRQSCKEPRP